MINLPSVRRDAGSKISTYDICGQFAKQFQPMDKYPLSVDAVWRQHFG